MQDNMEVFKNRINPDFVLESLAYIPYLYETKDKNADKFVSAFRDYLYAYLSYENRKDEIAFFEDELEILEKYSFIQKLRFPQIDIAYDFETTDFDVTYFSVLPLVAVAFDNLLKSNGGGYFKALQ